MQDLAAQRENTHNNDFDYSGIHAAAKGLRGINPHLRDKPQSLDELDDNGKAALHWACQGGNDAVVNLLIGSGANVNVENFDGETPLMSAAGRGNFECACTLLAVHGCDVNKTNSQGRSALHYAAASSYLGGYIVIELLLRHGANPLLANHGGETPLHELASSYTTKLPTQELHGGANVMVEAGVSLEATDRWKYTPLLQAVVEDNQVAVSILSTLGARPNVFDCDRQGVLHLAALYAGLSTVQELRESKISGIDVESLDYQEHTPFELFRWRLSTNISAPDAWVRQPTDEEDTCFRALVSEIRNPTLGADVSCCRLIIQALQGGDSTSALGYVNEAMERYVTWVSKEELDMFRVIKRIIESQSREAAICTLADSIKTLSARMKISPVFNDVEGS